jgi:hypothetical protein
MKLATSHRIALLLSAATIALTAVAPPWTYVDETPGRPAGFSWLWSPPGKSPCRKAPTANDLEWAHEHPEATPYFSKAFGCNPDETEDRVAELAWPTIALEWTAVLLVGGLTVAGLQRRTRKRASGKRPQSFNSSATVCSQSDVSADVAPTQQEDTSGRQILTVQPAEQQTITARTSEVKTAPFRPVNPSSLPPQPGEKRLTIPEQIFIILLPGIGLILALVALIRGQHFRAGRIATIAFSTLVIQGVLLTVAHSPRTTVPVPAPTPTVTVRPQLKIGPLVTTEPFIRELLLDVPEEAQKPSRAKD